MDIEIEILDYKPSPRVSIFAEVIQKLDALEEGQCIRLKLASRHEFNRVRNGVQGHYRQTEWRIATQLEDGFMYLYKEQRETLERV